MKKIGKYFLVVGISLVSFLGSYLQKGAKRNLNHIEHTVQNHDFAGSARVWRNAYFNYKNSEEKKKRVDHEVESEKSKISGQSCQEKCLAELGLRHCMELKSICKENCLAERDPMTKESCLNNWRKIWRE